MMDFAPTPEGIIAPDQAARYKEFGDWFVNSEQRIDLIIAPCQYHV